MALLSSRRGRVTGAGSSQKYAVILARPVHRVWGLGILGVCFLGDFNQCKLPKSHRWLDIYYLPCWVSVLVVKDQERCFTTGFMNTLNIQLVPSEV